MVKDKNPNSYNAEMVSFLNQLNEIIGNATVHANSDIAPLIRTKLKQINKICDLAALMPLLPRLAQSYPSSSWWHKLRLKSVDHLSNLKLLVKKQALHLAIVKGQLTAEEDQAIAKILHSQNAKTESDARLWEKYIQLQWRGVIHVSNPRKVR